MATNPNLSTTVIGGGGDDTIHLGGAPPPIVLDPPPFIYTPPPIVIEQPPEIVFDEIERFNGSVAVSTPASIFDIINSFFGGGTDIVTRSKLRALDIVANLAMGWINAARAQAPYFRNPSITVAGVELLRPNGTLKTPTDLGPALTTVLAAITVRLAPPSRSSASRSEA